MATCSNACITATPLLRPPMASPKGGRNRGVLLYNPIINESMASTIAIKVLEGVIRMDEQINALQNSALQQQLANAKREELPAFTPASINRAPSDKTITEYNHGLGNGESSNMENGGRSHCIKGGMPLHIIIKILGSPPQVTKTGELPNIVTTQ